MTDSQNNRASPAEAARTKRYLLIGESTPGMLKLLGLLEQMDCREEDIERVEQSAEAASLLESGNFAAGIIDLAGGPLTSLELSRTLRNYGSTTPLIVLTGEDTLHWEELVLGEGATDCIPVDLLDRRHLERSLRLSGARVRRASGASSEEEQRQIIESFASNATDAVIITSAPNSVSSSIPRIIYVNRTFTQLFGYSPEDVLGDGLELLSGEHTDKGKSAEIVSNMDLERPYQTEIIHYRKSGEPLWVELSLQPVRSESGMVTHWVCIQRPIEERKQIERNLEETSEHLELVLANAPVMLWSINPDRRISLCRGKELEVLGINPATAPGQLAEDLFASYPDLCEQIKATFRGNPQNSVISAGGHSFEVRHTPIYNDRNELQRLIGVAINLSERLEAERKLLEAKLKAEEATRSKSEFLANMSHEIRTPLNAILGFAKILSESAIDSTLRRYADNIMISGKSLLQLINDLLDLSKIEAGKLALQAQPVSPKDLVEEIRTIFSLQCHEKGLEFVVEADHTVPDSVLIDAVRLRQVCINLVGNAVKYTTEGRIRLSVHGRQRRSGSRDGLGTRSPTEVDDTRRQAGVKAHADLVIEIEDTGIGIAPEDQEKIFDAFTQIHNPDLRKAGGVGLGLAITRRLVGLMGGAIAVTSEPDKGSTFRLLFRNVPLADEAPKERTTEEITGPTDFRNARILVVDDNEMNIELVRGFLSDCNVTIYEAHDGKEALELARSCDPRAILLDMKMPVMDGYEATHLLKRDPALKKVPVIALTARTLVDEEKRIRDAGCDGFLRKPIDRPDLVRELRLFLDWRPVDYTPIPFSGNKRASQEQASPEPQPELAEQALTSLAQDASPLWEKARSSFIMRDVKEFASALEAVNTQTPLTMIDIYRNELERHLDNFDFDKIKQTLNDYPYLLDSIKKVLTH